MTDKGKIAHEHHMCFHSQLDSMVDNAMGERQEQELSGIVNFLEDILERLNTAEVK